MSGLPSCLLSKDTPLRGPPLTSKSPCRSTHRRVNSTSSRPPETRGVRYNANNNLTRTIDQRTQLPIYYSSPLRCAYDRLYLPTPNRPEVPNCLLICQPYRISCRRNPHPNPMRIHRRFNSYDCPWFNIFCAFLPCQH